MDKCTIIKIKIKDLPDGYYKSRLHEICVGPDVQVNVVANNGYANDFAAYIGFPGTVAEIKPEYQQNYATYVRSVHEAGDVLTNGDKLGQDEARVLFPEFKDLSYRR